MKMCTGSAAFTAAAALALCVGGADAQRFTSSGAINGGKATKVTEAPEIMLVGDGIVDGDGGNSNASHALWYNGDEDRRVAFMSTVNAHVSSQVADDCWLKEGMFYDCQYVYVRMAITNGFLPNTQLYMYRDCDGKPDSSVAPVVVEQFDYTLIDAAPGGDLDGTAVWEICYYVDQFYQGEQIRWLSPVHDDVDRDGDLSVEGGFGFWVSANNGVIQGRQTHVNAAGFGLPEWTAAEQEICCGICTDMYLRVEGKCCWRVLAQSNFDLDGLTDPVLAQNAPWNRSFDDFQLADPCKQVDNWGICRIEAYFATNCDVTTVYGEIFNNECDMPVDPDAAPYRLTPSFYEDLGMTINSGTTALPVYKFVFWCPDDLLPTGQNYWFSIFSEQGFVAGKRSVWLFQQRAACNIRLNEAKYRNAPIGYDMPTGVSDAGLHGAPRGHAFSVWVCDPGTP
ncbi:MAG: hypothetical protein DHS20C14_01790 [Phycisphaeraceae bacterium]|nr:MAG: hypothetical protein DHS20C14_01790 [Phycisphaeraceae bacterium]